MRAQQDQKISQIQKHTLHPDQLLHLKILSLERRELEEFLREEALENPLLELLDHPEKTADCGPADRAAPQHQAPEDYRQEIWEQCLSLQLDSRQSGLMKKLIRLLDDRGYLPCCEKKELLRLTGASLEELRELTGTLQSLDPPGIGAADLKECLLLQAKRLYPGDGLLKRIIENHLELVAANRLPSLSEMMEVSLEDVADCIRKIRSLSPYPVTGASGKKTEKVSGEPDLLAVPADDGWEIIHLGGRMVPVLSRPGAELLEQRKTDVELDAYLREKLRRARLVLGGCLQREKTLTRLARYLMEHQPCLSVPGAFREPLTMTRVAGALEMHVSTVSRAVRGKTIRTPTGIHFLDRMLGYDRDPGKKGDPRMARIRQLIREEDRKRPLSDQEIVRILEQESVYLSRRTVAKYRQEAGIPGSSGRKEYF